MPLDVLSIATPVRSRVRRYQRRILIEFHESLTEDHTPHQIAGSFALGAFITMLPTLGTGLLLFVVLIYIFESINRIALFSSVLVFNPVVKWGVYASSIMLGVLLLGPVDGISTTNVSLSAGPEVLVRLLLGNLILAAVATILSYVVVYRMAYLYQSSEVGRRLVESIEDITEEIATQDAKSPQE